MKLFKILAIAALAMVSSASAQAGAITGVVLSNLGSNGTTGSSGTSNDVIPPKAAAASFVVGASNFTLDKINIYAFGDSSSGVTGTLGIFASASGNPSSIDTAFALHTATQTMTGNDHYTFDFANPELTAGQTYWVLLRTSGTSSSWRRCGMSGGTW
ncbi:MAG: choice-of-anchor R domain-containing protein [Pirellula sp.]